MDCNIHTIASNILFFFYEKPSPLSPAAFQSQRDQFWWHFPKQNVIQNALPPSIQSYPLMALERAGYFIKIIPDPNYIFFPTRNPCQLPPIVRRLPSIISGNVYICLHISAQPEIITSICINSDGTSQKGSIILCSAHVTPVTKCDKSHTPF